MLGCRNGSPLVDILDGGDQFLGFRVFQQISQCAGLDGRKNLVIGGKTGQGQYARLGLPGHDLADGLDPIHAGHDQVHQDHIRLEGFGLLNGFQAVAGFADHFHPIHFRQQGAHAFTDNALIVNDQESDRFSGHRLHLMISSKKNLRKGQSY